MADSSLIDSSEPLPSSAGASEDSGDAKPRRTRRRTKSSPEAREEGSSAEAGGGSGGGDEGSDGDAGSRARSPRKRSRTKRADAKDADAKDADAKDVDAKDADARDADAKDAGEKAKRPSRRKRSSAKDSTDEGSGSDKRKGNAKKRDEELREADSGEGYSGKSDSGKSDSGKGDSGKSDSTKSDSGDRDTEAAPPHEPDSAPISQHLAKFSDRAIQRVTGGNAFLRGRLYARRGNVVELETKDREAAARVQVKPDTIYLPRLTLGEENDWTSNCNCPGFRGPNAHCKHVAALMVALRDRERPPRPKTPEGQKQEKKQDKEKDKDKDKDKHVKEVVAHNPQTVSVGGKRRRSRRRRRGEATIEMLTGAPATAEPRSSLDAWLPEKLPKMLDLEYRMQVRSAAIAVTPVLAGTKTPVPIADALAGFNVVSTTARPLLRALARHTNRGQPATAEIRGEDAAEVLTMLKDRRVLLEPASMELRFSDEPLKPKLELDQANHKAVRIRVVFESGPRRFLLSNGNWFEGTPGWHIDTTEGIARPVTDVVTPAWLQRLYRSPALVHPISELPRLLSELVPRVAASLGADLPDLDSVADLADASPAFVLRADGDILEATARLEVRYADLSFPVPTNGFPSPLEFLPPAPDAEGERPRVVRRDIGAEMAAVQELLNRNFVPNEAGEAVVARGDDAVAFWTENIAELPADWEKRVPNDLAKAVLRPTPVSPTMRVSSGVDWLSLDMSFGAEGVAVDEHELRACLEHGRNLVQLADGSYAPVRAEEVGEILERMAEIVVGEGDRSRLPLSQAGRVQDLLRLVGDQEISPNAKDLFQKLGDVGEVPQIAKPRNLKCAKFRDYQKRGFSWLAFIHEVGTGGILADDMGLGKTLQAIALLLWAKNKGKRKLSVVIAPTSVVPNWEREIQKFAPSMKTVVWQGPDRQDQRVELDDADVMISSYALLRRDEEFLQTLDLRYLILDEAQHIKNPLSATARAAKRLTSERRLAMTGTPIENRLSEIWSIFDFVAPGLLGSLKSFEERYARPIDRGDEETAAKLRTIIHPLIMRRTKQEVAPELPEKIEQEIIVPLADEQAKLYKQMLRQVRDSVLSTVDERGMSKAQIQILAALTRMRQVACDPRLTKLDGEWTDETSGKLMALKEIVEEAIAGGHRLLIFSQFVQMLGLIREMLDREGVVYEYLDGSTNDRQERVDRFNEDESVNAFLISLKAGGTGLNLTGADTVVHFDPWWNPAVEDQATDRAHRIGQTKVVSVYRLIARDTVEEKILTLSAKKRTLVSNVLSTEGTPLKGLTRADIDDLFS